MMSRAPARASSGGGDLLLLVHEGTGGRHGIEGRILGQQGLGQGLEAPLAGDDRAGAPFRPEGQVHVLELGQGLGGPDPGFELFREELTLIQGFEDGLASLAKLGELLGAIPDGGDRHLVQRPRGLLAVPRDEGHGGAFLEEGQGGLDLAGVHGELVGDL